MQCRLLSWGADLVSLRLSDEAVTTASTASTPVRMNQSHTCFFLRLARSILFGLPQASGPKSVCREVGEVGTRHSERAWGRAGGGRGPSGSSHQARRGPTLLRPPGLCGAGLWEHQSPAPLTLAEAHCGPEGWAFGIPDLSSLFSNWLSSCPRGL